MRHAAPPAAHDLLGHAHTEEQWEALCRRCGMCCFESRWTGSTWEHTNIPCRYLDADDRSCRVYASRFQAEPDCVRVTPSVVMQGILPVTCAYVRELERVAERYQAEEPDRRCRRSGRATLRRDREGGSGLDRGRRGRRRHGPPP